MDLLAFVAVALVFTAYSNNSSQEQQLPSSSSSSSSPEGEYTCSSEQQLELNEAEREQMHLLTSSSSTKWDYSHHLEKFVRWMPKVELHVHFDGSWDPTMIYQHYVRQQHQHSCDNNNNNHCCCSLLLLLPHESILPWDPTRPYPVRTLVEQCTTAAEFHSLCTCRGKRSLYDMLKAFEIFLPIVRGNLELLEQLAVDFVKRQAQQHIIYTEMRYSPHLLAHGGSLGSSSSTDNTTTQQEVNADPIVDAITRGLRRGEQDYGVKVNQILCCITWRPDWADDVVRLCYERRHDTPCAVVGIDICCGEQHFDSSHQSTFGAHKRAMERAMKYDIPITLHAGEVSEGDSSIQAAILDFGARRIGHGYRMSHAMMQIVKDAGVHVEICPTTSVETGGWLYSNGDETTTTTTGRTTTKDWKDHPAVHMMKRGLSLGLNSDDPSVFDTSLTWQWRIALGKMGLTVEQVQEMTKHAIRAAFLSDDEKESLLELVEQHTPLHTQPRLLQKHSFSDRVAGKYQVCMENC